MIRINQLKLNIDHKEVSDNNLNYIVSDMPTAVDIPETKSSTKYLTVPKEEDIKKAVAEKLKIELNSINKINIIKRSIDARKKEEIKYIYSIEAEINKEDSFLKRNKSIDIMKASKEEYTFNITGTKKLNKRPVIIGSGPAGLFCAYLLAQSGYCPLIIERGEPVEERTLTVQRFWDMGILNEESNIQFGEGGAGTFSDGKLNTLNKDTHGRIRKILEIYAEYGAPSEILYLNKPHIGTDCLKIIVKNIRNAIIKLGGEFRFHTKLTDIDEKDGKIVSIRTESFNSKQTIECEVLVLAIGHSARDTFYMLHDRGIHMEAKAFAAGVRIEHEQDFIDKVQYGMSRTMLPPAEYKLTHKCKNNRGVFTFCMCPGGFVVNASSEAGRLTVNGMSNYARSEKNANSAVIAQVFPQDFIEETGNNTVLAGIEFQRKYEKLAYTAANGAVPIQLFGDLIRNKKSDTIGRIIPNIKGSYALKELRSCLPAYLIDSIIEGIQAFDKSIKGFADEEAVLSGIEMRTSSPIRIIRNDEYVTNIDGIYPCGEGAGYAGGIISAAVDGIKVFEAFIKKYIPNSKITANYLTKPKG